MDRVFHFFQRLDLARHQNDMGARSGECLGGGSANAAAGTGDERGLAGEHGFEFVVQAPPEVGADGARRDGVGADAALTELLGHVAGKHLQPTLEGGVWRHPGGGHTRGGTGDVDDARASTQQRQQCLGKEERPLQVHVEQTVELFLGHGLDRIEQPEPGVVHQATQRGGAPGALQGVLHLRGKCRKAAGVAHIQLQGHCRAAFCLDALHHQLGSMGLGVVGEDDAHAALRAVQRGAGTNATAAAGDQYVFHAGSPVQ